MTKLLVEDGEMNTPEKGAAGNVDAKKKLPAEGHQEAEYTTVDHRVAATETGIIETWEVESTEGNGKDYARAQLRVKTKGSAMTQSQEAQAN